MNQEKFQIYQKREEFRNEIRHQRNEQLFKRRRVFTNETTSDAFLQMLQQIDITNSELANEAINTQIPKTIQQALFFSDININYAIDLLKNKRALLIESVYLLNCLTAHIDNTEILKENISQNFLSYLASLYNLFIDIIINDKEIPLILDYIDCIFYNLELSKIELQIQDKILVIQSIKKLIKKGQFSLFSLQGMETMLALYNKIQIDYTQDSLDICIPIITKFQEKELLQLIIRLVLKTLSLTVKSNTRQIQQLLIFFKKENYTQILIDLMQQHPNIVLEYFKSITNYQKFIPLSLLNYQQANYILQNWHKFERAPFYQFLANIIPIFDFILNDFLQNKELLEEVILVLQTKSDRMAKEAFYLLCQVLKEEKMQHHFQLIGVVNQYFLNCESTDEQKFYLELVIQNPTVMSINCSNKVQAKLDSLVLIPELETLVKRIVDW